MQLFRSPWLHGDTRVEPCAAQRRANAARRIALLLEFDAAQEKAHVLQSPPITFVVADAQDHMPLRAA